MNDHIILVRLVSISRKSIRPFCCISDRKMWFIWLKIIVSISWCISLFLQLLLIIHSCLEQNMKTSHITSSFDVSPMPNDGDQLQNRFSCQIRTLCHTVLLISVSIDHLCSTISGMNVHVILVPLVSSSRQSVRPICCIIRGHPCFVSQYHFR